MVLNLLWLLSSRLFQAGLALKIVLILLLVPQIHESSFVLFLQFLVRNPSIDPWTRFLDAGGNLLSCPYGPVMLAVHLPGVIAGMAIDAIAGTDIFAYIGLRAGLLVVDFAVFALLCQIFRKQNRKLIIFYWFSPIILFATYWVGQADVVTVALMILSILFMKGNRTLDAGWALGLSSAANLIMTAALPFMAIYLWRNKRLRHLIAPFVGGFAAVSVLLHAPLLLSPGFRRMALGSYGIDWIYDLALPIGQSIEVYPTLVLYMLSLYAMWRLARISFDLLIAIIGLTFFVLVLVPPAPISRYVWVVPFLVAYQLRTNRTSIVLVNGFSATIIGYHLLRAPGPRVPFLNQTLTDLIEPLKALITPHYLSLWMTVSIVLGCILIMQILCEGVCRNDIFRLGMRPISVGISGDSGSGKDTLSLNLAGLFGTHSVVYISGDNYHLWDRYAPMWKALTHLNPRANDLDRFRGDVLSLLDGRGVVCRSYDHTVGRFSRPKLIKSNDVLIVSGLHALYNETLAKHFDIKVYLDICEDLRFHWKIQRDVHQRGHPLEKVLATLERREQDSKQYIHPQKNRADLIFSLAPANMAHLQVSPLPNPLRLKLKVLVRNSSYHERLAKILIGVCGLYLEMDDTGNGGEIIMEIEGDVEGSDLALAVHNFDPHLIQIFDLNPRWVDGMAGVMQMITLIHLDEAVRRRI